MTFRPATAADCPLLAKLNHQLIQDEGHRNCMSVSELEQRMRGWLAGEYRAVICESGGEAVAYALFREQPGEIYLRHLFVVRHCRRQGIGRQVLQFLRSEIWPKTKRFTVEVLAGNKSAIAFWRAAGYTDYSLTLEILPASLSGGNLGSARRAVSIGLIGDYDETVPAHQAIPLALRGAAEASGVSVEVEWVPTEEVTSSDRISRFDGLWCVPASPYRSMAGALLAIRHAREAAIPFLGTCGGFQHAVIEYARNVLGWADAEHAETAPDSPRAVISPLVCALVEKTGSVRLFPGSRIAAAYGVEWTTEGYHCRYGLNPAFRAALAAGPLRATAEDESGEVRAIELDGHPFFVATLFQPERSVLDGKPALLIGAFVKSCGRTAVHSGTSK